jgi:hypothetical protein
VKSGTAIEPQPWWQVGLAILPGVLVFVSTILYDLGLHVRLLQFLVLPVIILLLVSSIVWAIARHRSFGVAAWGLIPLGLLANMGLHEVTDFCSIHFVLIAVGLLLVKYSGLRAGLFVLVGSFVPVEWNIEPEVFLWDSPFWTTVCEVNGTVLFFILAPVWVLRAGSVYGQAAGLLLPIVIYFVVLVSALSAARGFSIAQSASIGNPVLVLLVTVAVAVVLHGTVSSRLTMANP